VDELTTLLANVICTVAPLAADAAVASAPTMKRGNSVCLCLFIFDFMFLFCYNFCLIMPPPRESRRGRIVWQLQPRCRLGGTRDAADEGLIPVLLEPEASEPLNITRSAPP
jgi:hypothetical protein